MALGECGYDEALPLLRLLSTGSHKSTMIYTALGDSIIRLARRYDNDADPVLELLESRNLHLIEGAFRAMAMLRMVIQDCAVRQIVTFAEHVPRREAINHGLWFWLVVAAAGWKVPESEQFLRNCTKVNRQDISKAAACALNGEYMACTPL
jgi:hypothetical protein